MSCHAPQCALSTLPNRIVQQTKGFAFGIVLAIPSLNAHTANRFRPVANEETLASIVYADSAIHPEPSDRGAVEFVAPESSPPTQGEPNYAAFVEIVRKVETGDEAGMEDLYALLCGGIRFSLMRRLESPDVEDNLHEVFVDLVSAIRRREIREPARLMGYVRTVIHRKVTRQIGDASRTRTDEEGSTIEHLADTRNTPEQMVAAAQQTSLVEKILRALKPRERELLVRFYIWEQSREQICEEMALSSNQFRLFKSRAKARFGYLGKQRAGL